MKEKLELYLHIPFCVRKCAYCDFLSGPSDKKMRQEYVDALCREIRLFGGRFQNNSVDTVFMGGGTPSILTSRQIEDIFQALRENFKTEENAEITIEANPGTVSTEKLESWKCAGINRVSIGLQSADDDELKMLGRIHDYSQFLDTWEKIRKAGFENVNIDLISAIPGQTLESWRKTLCTVAELNPEHLSAYSLIIEEGTPFYEHYGQEDDSAQKKERQPDLAGYFPPLPDEDTERLIYEETEEILRKYGYRRYEISNYAKEGFECRHNIGYWRRTQYLGLGLGAASFLQKQRFHNTENYHEYIESVRQGSLIREDLEILSLKDEMAEFMFLGLRLTEGVRRSAFNKSFGKTMEEVYGLELQKLLQQRLIEADGDFVRLTKRGIDISNYVFGHFI